MFVFVQKDNLWVAALFSKERAIGLTTSRLFVDVVVLEDGRAKKGPLKFKMA